jgi:hypothetical protein
MFEHSVICFSRLYMWQKEKCVLFSESASDILRYFPLLRKHCWSVWEFDNMLSKDKHIIVWRTFRGIWRTITFHIILTITNATGKIFPSSDKNGVQLWCPTSYVMTYSPTSPVVETIPSILRCRRAFRSCFLGDKFSCRTPL